VDVSNYQLSINNYQLPEGYKQTEVGVIPEDWDIDKLASLTQSKRPISYGIVQTGRPIEGGVACIRVFDIKDGIINDKDLITTSKEINNSYKRTILNEGDLIIALRGKIGELAVVTKEFEGANLTRGVALIALQEIYSSHFYKQYLSSAESKIRLQNSLNGSALQELPIATVRSFPIAIPPLPEQRAIAATLSDVDALITSLDKLIAKQRHLKTATMQQLLTGKKRLPGFGKGKGYKQTEVGLIPEDWDCKKIGSFTDCTAGGTPSTLVDAYWGGSIKWMSSGELHKKTVYEVESRITDKGLKNSSAKLLPVSCVLIGLAGQGKTRGTVAVNAIKLCTNQSIAAIFPDNSFDSRYLFHNLDSRYEELRGLSTGDGGRGGLNLTIIRNTQLPFPRIEEQHAIATVLSDMDAAISALETRRAKTQAIKQGMMQELLTGKTRLIINE
jgi:type I restriction enzyme S subunit